MDEHDLAQRAVQGDREAFGELVRLHQSGVYNTAYHMTGNRQEAEDAVQEAFLRAFRSMGRLDPTRPPGPWFRKIAVNVCLNRLERHPPLPLEEAVPVASREPLPETHLVEKERKRQIRSALLSLNPRQRAAVELRHFEELSYAEMAETLGRPLSDVKSDLFRARKKLAERLKEMR
jgi:RNA polymerase sigma-70 factor (ECF subfamily)